MRNCLIWNGNDNRAWLGRNGVLVQGLATSTSLSVAVARPVVAINMASNAAKLPVKKEKLQPLRSKFQELILRAVIAKEVKVVEDTIALFKENHSLFSSDDQHAGKPFRPFDFFPLSEAASQRQTQGDPTVNVKVHEGCGWAY